MTLILKDWEQALEQANTTIREAELTLAIMKNNKTMILKEIKRFS